MLLVDEFANNCTCSGLLHNTKQIFVTAALRRSSDAAKCNNFANVFPVAAYFNAARPKPQPNACNVPPPEPGKYLCHQLMAINFYYISYSN